MLPGTLDNQSGRAWSAFFETMQAGARAAYEFGSANLPMPLPLKELLGMETASRPQDTASQAEVTLTPPPPKEFPTPESIKERFPLGAAFSCFGKTGKVVGYNTHPNGTHLLVDLGGPGPASVDPDHPA